MPDTSTDKPADATNSLDRRDLLKPGLPDRRGAVEIGAAEKSRNDEQTSAGD